jgi:uncharacterized protein (TIGR03067 family)
VNYPLSIFLAVGAAIPAFSGGSLDDAKAIQGTWHPVKAELAGQPLPESVLKVISLKLHDGKYAVLVGANPDSGIYALDATVKPRGMTVTGTAGPNIGKTFPAIYELKGDTLTICYDLSGAKRPTEFKTVTATKLYLVTYVRQKE